MQITEAHTEPASCFSAIEKSVIKLDGACLSYYPAFLSPLQSRELQQWLSARISWQQARISLFGKQVQEPRLTAWFADSGVDYRYSGRRLRPLPWPKPLLQLRWPISALVCSPFNAVLANYYRDGSDYMGWHSDDEHSLGSDPVIASLSLGLQRPLQLRRKDDHQIKHQLDLADGSLLVMQGACQQYWQHALPRRLRVKQPRFNLTFRQVYAKL